MSFGLMTWGASGAVQLNTDTFTYQVIHNQLYKLTVDAVITIPIPEFSPGSCVASILPTQAAQYDFNFCLDAIPYMTVAEGQVVIRSRNPSEPDSTNGSAIEFRLLVMRYKN